MSDVVYLAAIKVQDALHHGCWQADIDRDVWLVVLGHQKLWMVRKMANPQRVYCISVELLNKMLRFRMIVQSTLVYPTFLTIRHSRYSPSKPSKRISVIQQLSIYCLVRLSATDCLVSIVAYNQELTLVHTRSVCETWIWNILLANIIEREDH